MTYLRVGQPNTRDKSDDFPKLVDVAWEFGIDVRLSDNRNQGRLRCCPGGRGFLSGDLSFASPS